MKTMTILLASVLSIGAVAQTYTEVQKVIAPDRSETDLFGYAVAISGDVAIVGAYFEDEDAFESNTITNTGSVYVYERNGSGNWILVQKLVASDRSLNDSFGFAVDISNDKLVVGARWEDLDAAGSNNMFNAGAAYVFEQNGSGTWVQVQKLVASDRDLSDEFGSSVSISGDRIIIGVEDEDEDASGSNTLGSAGSAYIFERNGSGTWVEVQKLVSSDRAMNDKFGHEVSIDGDYAIVSAVEEEDDEFGGNNLNLAGSAYIFERDGTGTWNQIQKIVAPDRAEFDKFGDAVAISGDRIVVGAALEDEDASGGATETNAGSAYVFERTGSVWNFTQKLVASDRQQSDNFGWSVAIDGDHLIAGAHLEDQNPIPMPPVLEAGAAYIFERDGSGIWTEIDKIGASDRQLEDFFGHTVAISGPIAIVGAYWEDHDTTSSNFVDAAGSAYIYESPAVPPPPTMIEESDLAHMIHIFPNPTNGPVTIQVASDITITAYLFDVVGTLIHEYMVPRFQPTFEIDLLDQPDGAYLMLFVAEDGTKETFRIIKE